MQNDKTRIRMIPSIVENVAIFLWHANLSVRAACSSWLRNLLGASFKEGRKAYQNPGYTRMADILRRLIPKLTPPLLRAALSKVSSKTRSEVIKICQEDLSVGFTIDGVTINSRHFLNKQVVHPLPRTQPFTFDFLAEGSYRTREFVQ
jgi:hypothetical protein